MHDKTNALHVRVMYSTDCPEWWRIQVRRELGKQGLATRQECVDWLHKYGQSEDDNLEMAYARWQQTADEGEEVPWA